MSETRRAWIIAQDTYIEALEQLDRAGDRLAFNRSHANRRHFGRAQSHLRDVERRLGEQWDADAEQEAS
jgi:hypothetical protein